MEIADPRPFFGSSFSKMLYALLLIEVLRQFLTWRLEVSHEAVVSAESWKARVTASAARFTSDARYRMRRAVTILATLYAFGWLVDSMTERCSSAVQCALLAPRLAIENLPMALQIAFYIAMGLFQMFAMFYAMTKVGFVKFVMPGTTTTTFDDVYGQDAAKEKVQEQVSLLDDDDDVARAGGYMPKGVLLWGPPGTGKTMLAKAAANATTKPLILIPPGAFASTFIGINFLKVWLLFRYIRKYALRYKGVIVFIDEIDSLGNRGLVFDQITNPNKLEPDELGCAAKPHERHAPDTVIVNGGGGGMNMGTLEAFLAALDGMEEPRGMINRVLKLLSLKPIPPPKYRYMILAATNMKEKVDAALLRPGRIGRHVHVDFPKFDGKLQTYRGYLGKVKHTLSDEDIEWVARNHYHGTGAEIEDVVNEAVLVTFRDGRPKSKQGIITRDDILNTMLWQKVGESDGRFESPDSQWAVAVHEAGHAVIQHHWRSNKERIWFGSIEQRGRTGGMIYPVPLHEDWHALRSDLENDIAVSLGSRVAEYLFFDEMSNGHGGDGLNATRTAEQMVWLGHTYNTRTGKGRISSVDRRKQDDYQDLVEAILKKQLKRTIAFLRPRKDQIEALANLFMEKGTVPGDEIHALLDEMEAAHNE